MHSTFDENMKWIFGILGGLGIPFFAISLVVCVLVFIFALSTGREDSWVMLIFIFGSFWALKHSIHEFRNLGLGSSEIEKKKIELASLFSAGKSRPEVEITLGRLKNKKRLSLTWFTEEHGLKIDDSAGLENRVYVDEGVYFLLVFKNDTLKEFRILN